MTNAVNLASAAGTGFAFRNRLINSAMEIDQRRGGSSASSAANSGYTYVVDRWRVYNGSAGAFTLQQSSVAPSGFTKSSLITVTSPESSLAAGSLGSFEQAIEGFNISDLAYGTASAKPVTLSFWVRCSVTGTFDIAFRNNFSLTQRAYVTTYTVSSANTWEYKTITVPGDTTGSYSTDNNAGLFVIFSTGAGSTYQTATTNAWQSANVFGTAGSTKLVSNSGATFYLTGVQLEVGSVATPFERRPYGLELTLCQRYYENGYNIWSGYCNGASNYYMQTPFKVTKRTSPTITFSGPNGSGFPSSSPNIGQVDSIGFRADPTSNAASTAGYYQFFFSASAEL